MFARSLAAFSLLFLLGMHCNSNSRITPTHHLNDLAHSYCRLALALTERDPDSLDFYIGPKEIADEVHTSYPTLDQTRRDMVALIGQLEHFPVNNGTETMRVRFMLAQLMAMQARIKMLQGIRFDFDTESRLLFNVERLPDTDAAARRITLIAIDRELPGKRGQALAYRYAAFGQRFIVPREHIQQVMLAALDACRRRTREHLVLPAGEKVSLEYVRNKPWNAFSRYHGDAESTIEINTDSPLTVDRALELACHEGYPGHHVFNTLWDAVLVQKNGWPEAQVQLTFSPQSFLSEAAAAYASRLAFSLEERTRIERDVLFPLAGLDGKQAARYVSLSNKVDGLDSALPAIARYYLDGRLEFVRAQQRLEAEALMTHSEALLLYLNEYRTYMLAYTDGKRQIDAYIDPASQSRALAQQDDAARWSRYRGLIDTLMPPKELFQELQP